MTLQIHRRHFAACISIFQGKQFYREKNISMRKALQGNEGANMIERVTGRQVWDNVHTEWEGEVGGIKTRGDTCDMSQR